MEITESSVIPTHEELIEDLMDTLTEIESDPVHPVQDKVKHVQTVSEPSASGPKSVTVQSVQSNLNETATIKVAENLDSDVSSVVATDESVLDSSITPEIKPLGAKDSMKGEAGITKKGKKKRKKKLPQVVADQFEDTTTVIEKLKSRGFGTKYNGHTYGCRIHSCDFCDFMNRDGLIVDNHVRDNHFEELCEFLHEKPDWGTYL